MRIPVVHQIFCLLSVVSVNSSDAVFFKVSPQQAQGIGKKIWKNECGGTIEGLTHWNEGEAFGSFGIGHFIWFPQEKAGGHTIFDQQFPRLREFLNDHGKVLPLLYQGKCPWKTRQEFLKQFNSQHMIYLRNFLAKTIDLQAQYIIERFENSIPYILKHVPASRRVHIKKQLQRVAGTPQGLYALIDYMNFKGEGIKLSEQYGGKRWGLLAVLNTMRGESMGTPARAEFARCAKVVLTERVNHAPAGCNEARWLPGWISRVNTYI